MNTPITKRQAEIFRLFLRENNLAEDSCIEELQAAPKRVKSTAKILGVDPETVRQTVSKVLNRLSQGQKLPPVGDFCPRCQGQELITLPDTLAGNPQFFCQSCQKNFVVR
jgi:transposase-like protein